MRAKEPLAMDWDLTTYFPALQSPAYAEHLRALTADIGTLTAELAALAPLDEATAGAWSAAVGRYEGLLARYSHVASFVTCLVSCDATDPAHRDAEARISGLGAAYRKLGVELMRGLRDADDTLFDRWLSREELTSARHFLAQTRVDARQSMDPPLEKLAADLGTDGIEAWGRLYDTLSSTLSFTMRWPDGRTEKTAMSQRRSLLGDADRTVREAAFRGGNDAWAGVEDVVASALNHIVGTRLTLQRRRGIAHFLDVALHDAAISRGTLDAMWQAVESEASIPRRYLKLKARAMGLEAASWFDLEAPLPVPNEEGRISWPQGVSMVRDAFAAGYPALAEFYGRAIDRRWVEHTPRDTKRPGAYCTTSKLSGESRVFMTYQGALGDVSTLAHEMGHAYHAHVMRGMRPLARLYPMTLAESASTFAELLLADGLLGAPGLDEAQRALLLGAALDDGVAFLLDIPVRFRFEHALYEERAGGELSAGRLKELMQSTQREVFGDALADDGVDPYFWASKLHFYITGVSFYNFPYTFGYLLSRGLFAQLQADGPSFLPRYERFLELTGSDMAHVVAHDALGQDLESPEFWATSIRSLQAPLDALEALLPGLTPR